MEEAIYKLFFINVSNLITTKAALAKNFHIQPSEIDKMPYWEYEFFLISLNEQVKEENDKQKAEMDKYDVKGAMKAANPKNIQKMSQSMTPKMPSFNSMPGPNFGKL